MSLVITAGLRSVFTFVGLATFSMAVAAQDAGTIKIGKEIKKTAGVVKSLENGDVACYLNLRDEQGKEFTELGDFDICFQKPSIIGKRVSLKYRLEDVMADECQGNPDCKKSKKVALVVEARIMDGKADAKVTTSKATSAPQEAGQSSFCTPLEDVVFACRAGAKLISVCASKDASRNKGYVQYRFGKPDSRDPLELMLPEGQSLPAKSASGEITPFAGGGGAWLRFGKTPFSYVVYSGIGKWGPKGETLEKQGVVVERGGKAIANVKCTGKLTSLLGPDWLEKVGISSKGQEFDFPN